MFRNISFYGLLFSGLFAAAGCASTLPNKEYALAEAALQSAKKFSADKLAPKTYFKALFFYQKAELWYKRQNYEEASKSFESAIRLAEKAELKARAAKQKEEL